ncbi:hypothetical protein EW145_g1611, partial [Phellinidium pouzarii]
GASRGVIDVVRRAREAAKQKDRKKKKEKGEYERKSIKDKEKTVDAEEDGEENGDEITSQTERAQPKRKTYSAELVKRLGFDPTLKAYGAQSSGSGKKGANGKLGAAPSQKREIQLGPPPGSKVRSGVLVPPAMSSSNPAVGSKADLQISKRPEDASSASKPETTTCSETDSDLEIESPITTVSQRRDTGEDSDELEYS